MLTGIVPIVFIPFDSNGDIDEASLRRVVQFELEQPINGLGVNGFASEAYKLTDDERRRTVEIVASEVANQVPLVIGIAPGSTEAAIQQAREFSAYQPEALMTLPPATMQIDSQDLVDHYVTLGKASDAPIMVQQSPHIQAYSATGLSSDRLAEIAERSPNVKYFKIEGPGSDSRIESLAKLVNMETTGLFGGGGGITFLSEAKAGASGLIPGVGFNEIFVEMWDAWTQGNHGRVEQVIAQAQPLIKGVSGRGHEFSLHARKHLLQRKGIIETAYVRRPTVAFDDDDRDTLFEIADSFDLRISL